VHSHAQIGMVIRCQEFHSEGSGQPLDPSPRRPDRRVWMPTIWWVFA